MKKLICLLLAFISLDGIAQFKYDPVKRIIYDDCEKLPKVGWGINPTVGYAMVTGGSQQVNNPDPRTGIKMSTQAYTGKGSYEVYVTPRPDMYGSCCQWTRSEVMHLDPGYQKVDSFKWNYSAISIRIDPSWQFETRRTLVAYDHKEDPDDLQTPWGLTVEGDQFAFGGRFSKGAKIGKVEKGKWYRFVMHRNWESDNSGFLYLYMNGKLVFEHHGPNADGRPGSAPFVRLQHGIYKWVLASANGQGEGTGQALPGENPNAPMMKVTMQMDDIMLGLEGGTTTLADFFMDGTVTPPPPPPTPKETYKINAGGLATGEFSADQFFSGGSTYSTTGTTIYSTERYGNFSYAFPVPSGIYQVKLHFAEIYHTASGARVFNVKSEGMSVLTNYDIFKEVGTSAVIKSFSQPVSDGTLNLSFETVTDNAKVSAIEILPLSEPPPQPTANAGPDQTITLPVSTASLNGTGTNGNPQWRKLTTLAGSITNPNTFTTTVTGLSAGSHDFELSVGSAKDTVRIIVYPEPTPPPLTVWVKEVRTELRFIEGALRLVAVVSYTDGSEKIIEKK